MSDEFPPGWPTAEQRARVDARSRALRNRGRATGAGALVVVVALVAGVLAITRGGSASPGVRVASQPTTTTTPVPVPTVATVPVPTTSQPLASTPEPAGWRIVDYGDARFALPPGWSAAGPGSSTCAPLTAVGVTFRSNGPGCAYVGVEQYDVLRALPHRPALTIHGIDLYRAPDSRLPIDFAVPALNVHVYSHDLGAARPVLDTLTLSARRVVLDSTTWPSVPPDWKPLTVGDVTLAVPPTMPVTHLDAHTIAPGVCGAVPFPRSGAFLGVGAGLALFCPAVPSGIVPVPTDGVWMHAADPREIPPVEVDRIVRNRSTRVAVRFVPGYGVQGYEPALDLTILGSGGRRSTTTVRIGLGADPTVARTILASLRPA